MQATVCKEQIGWRDNARRIMLIATDIQFHVQGDGAVSGSNKFNLNFNKKFIKGGKYWILLCYYI